MTAVKMEEMFVCVGMEEGGRALALVVACVCGHVATTIISSAWYITVELGNKKSENSKNQQRFRISTSRAHPLTQFRVPVLHRKAGKQTIFLSFV